MVVYLTKRNADLNEGRGPMIDDLCFANLKDAQDYIDDQPGCQGRRAKWSQQTFGDWMVVNITVLEEPFDKAADALAKAKAKLKKALAAFTAEEKEILGLNEKE